MLTQHIDKLDQLQLLLQAELDKEKRDGRAVAAAVRDAIELLTLALTLTLALALTVTPALTLTLTLALTLTLTLTRSGRSRCCAGCASCLPPPACCWWAGDMGRYGEI